MKKENITIYSCEHCSKISRVGGAMARHEQGCKKNPANINACVGCKFLGVDEVEKYTDSFDGNFGMDTLYTFNVFRCKKLNQNMYPAKAKRKIKDYPESFKGKVQMPNTCEHYEVEIIEESEIELKF